MRRAFSTTGSDLMKVKELMERKQRQHETFSDYVSDMHNLNFKLKHKIDEDEFVELLKIGQITCFPTTGGRGFLDRFLI